MTPEKHKGMEITFDENGCIRYPAALLKNKEEQKHCIIIQRVQVNAKNPAIARLEITFPEPVLKPQNIIDFYKNLEFAKFRSVDHDIMQIDNKTFFIEVKQGSRLMYSSLEYLIDHFRSWLETEKRVIVKGQWDKFQANFEE